MRTAYKAKGRLPYGKRPFLIPTPINHGQDPSGRGKHGALVKTKQSVGFRILQALHDAFLADVTDALG